MSLSLLALSKDQTWFLACCHSQKTKCGSQPVKTFTRLDVALILLALSKDQMSLLVCWHFQKTRRGSQPASTFKRPDVALNLLALSKDQTRLLACWHFQKGISNKASNLLVRDQSLRWSLAYWLQSRPKDGVLPASTRANLPSSQLNVGVLKRPS